MWRYILCLVFNMVLINRYYYGVRKFKFSRVAILRLWELNFQYLHLRNILAAPSMVVNLKKFQKYKGRWTGVKESLWIGWWAGQVFWRLLELGMAEIFQNMKLFSVLYDFDALFPLAANLPLTLLLLTLLKINWGILKLLGVYWAKKWFGMGRSKPKGVLHRQELGATFF